MEKEIKEFSDCYGSFEECYKNKCTCRCHQSTEKLNNILILEGHFQPIEEKLEVIRRKINEIIEILNRGNFYK